MKLVDKSDTADKSKLEGAINYVPSNCLTRKEGYKEKQKELETIPKYVSFIATEEGHSVEVD